MKPTRHLPLLVALLAACTEQGQSPLAPALELPAPARALIVHNVTNLPTLGGTDSRAAGINDFGQAVGSSSFNASGDSHGFLWENGVMKDLGTLGGLSSSAHGVNDLGQVVGSSKNGSHDDRAFLWENGTMRDLGTLGGMQSFGSAVNNRGQVVGQSAINATEFRAFLWQSSSGMQNIGTLPGGNFSNAVGVNNLGQVVGTGSNSAGVLRAFLWENGAMRDLGSLGGTTSGAHDVNEFGQVVGQSTLSSGEIRAYLWQHGTMRDLGTLPGYYSSAAAINDLGQVAGRLSAVSSGTVPPLAFVWMDGTMYILGGDVASGINNDGQVTGYRMIAGETRGVVWDVPIRPPTDIEPGDATNSVSLNKNKNLTVAILSNPYFNAQGVDAASLTLGDEQGGDTPGVRDKRGQPLATYRDIDGDGDTDLVLEFSKKELIAKVDLASTTVKLVLLGKRTDGRALRAVEPVTVVP